MQIESKDIELYEAFAEAACLNKKHDPWVKRREPAEYANILIASSEYDNWWYAAFIGVECLGLLRFEYGTKKLKDIIVCRLVGTKIHTGRSISPNDAIIQ